MKREVKEKRKGDGKGKGCRMRRMGGREGRGERGEGVMEEGKGAWRQTWGRGREAVIGCLGQLSPFAERIQ